MNVEDRIENAKEWGDAMHASIASAELLLEIRDLLKAQMAGAKPSMPVITPARRPAVEDTPVDDIPNKDHKGMITFPCAARPMTDSITIDTNHIKGFNRHLFIDFEIGDEGGDNTIGLSMADARKFAKAILREVGES